MRSDPAPFRDETRTIRIAAISDLHVRQEIPSQIAEALRALSGNADLLIIPGDLTDGGRVPEMAIAADLLAELDMPKVAVLGNHDRRGLRRREMRLLLQKAGATLLDGAALTMEFGNGMRLGLVGIGGYGGGFWPEEVPDIVSARLSKAVALRARRESQRLETALEALSRDRTNANLVVMHYSPTISTLGNEPPIKYWMLGNSLLGKIIDEHHVDLVLHGHAHLGNYEGQTPGGVPVRNVAAQVIGQPMVFDIESTGEIIELTADGIQHQIAAAPTESVP